MSTKNNNTNGFVKNFIFAGFVAICASSISVYFSTQFTAIAQRSSLETERSPERSYLQLCQNIPSSNLSIRTELFFGSQKPDGSEVTDAEFQTFLNSEVTPRFPEGLTLLSGSGQFRNSQNVIVKENSKLLILLYPIDKEGTSSKKIEQIRRAYKANFKQESVLRTDNRSCVSF
jgi:hypothetical protein